jgi:hypothetical protein
VELAKANPAGDGVITVQWEVDRTEVREALARRLDRLANGSEDVQPKTFRELVKLAKTNYDVSTA